MFQNKGLFYGLVAGAAAIAVGVAAYSSWSQEEDVENSSMKGHEDEVKKLGPVKYEKDGNHLDFDYFLKIFELSVKYGKFDYADQRRQYMSQRRLIKDDPEVYRIIVIKMYQEQEEIINIRLEQILMRLNISEHDFQQSIVYHSQDQEKQRKIIKSQKQISDVESEDIKILTRDQVINAFKTQMQIEFELMQQIKNSTSPAYSMDQNIDEQEQMMKLMLTAIVEQCRVQDMLFEKTGIEEQQLLHSIDQLRLKNDEEFCMIVADAQKKGIQLAQY